MSTMTKQAIGAGTSDINDATLAAFLSG